MISIFKYIFLFLFTFFSFGFNIDLTKPNELMNVLYHETTNFEEHNRKEQNAKNRGETGAGIFSLKNFGNKNTNGMSKTEWIVANANKDTISTGTLGLVSDLYNTATKKGEGEPFIISSIVTGLIVTGSLYSIQDSARKIYAWFDGEGYKGNRTYIDPINGEVYTAEGNIKEGALELGVAATIGVVAKGVGNKIKNGIKSNINKNALVEAKFEPKIKKQLSKRGWTEESVENCINNSVKKYSTIDNRNNPLTGIKNNAPATLYVAKDGSYVIRNDVTGDIVQISNKYDKNWKWPTNLKEKK